MNFLNKIRDFVEGNYNYFIREHNAPHINEQAMWRAYQCQDCLKSGKCRYCGCKTPNMFFSPNKVDSNNKWGKMVSEAEWNAYKEKNPEYKMFERLNKQHIKEENASTELYREQQELLGYTPPLSDPFYPIEQRIRQERFLEDNVGNSPDASSTLTILQSTISRTEGDSDEGLSGDGRTIEYLQSLGPDLSGGDDDSGTETSDLVETED